MSARCMFCDYPATHIVKLASRRTEWALVTYIHVALSGADVCAAHAAKADKLYFPGGMQYGGWVLDGVVPLPAVSA